MASRPNIALGHQSRVGKDTAADYLCEHYGYTRVRIAENLYKVCSSAQEILGLPVKKDPDLLQTFGTDLKRIYGNNIFIEAALRAAAKITGPVVVIDARFNIEADALRKSGYLIVKLARKNRVIDRDPNHPSETELSEYPFDEVIHNDGSIEDLYRHLDEVVSSCSTVDGDLQ